ncbi:AAA family ATPase [Diaphorobacter caeni]|uniref:AAA family ATPase n=1 Tax=Diaphorobacter caeni TaxID=2784387 RepID=UPI001890830B|nr:AAA family ATPase [Diaphorobacter caeni]MBF5006634.1 AAA family ATPase [Diaphorobacter caeni]
MSDPPFTLVIKTKLAPPRVGGALVRREQILAALQTRPHDALTLILGPGGSGKTVLCALWRQQLVISGCDVAWYNLGAEDDDEAQFVDYIAASLQSAGLALGADAAGLYNRSGGKSLDAFLAVLVNALQQHERPLYLMLEDFHYIRSSAITHFIDKLAALAPPNFHLVISSRVRPSLDLVPLRVKNQLSEFSFSDLRFTLEESMSFMRNQRIDHLTPTQLRTLHQLTDGWPAGLQLAAFSLRKTQDADAYLRRFTETLTPSRDHSLRDYLSECISDHLNDEELDFLVRTSACRRFNRALCEQITGNERAGELLEKFEAEHLFLLPILGGGAGRSGSLRFACAAAQSGAQTGESEHSLIWVAL